MSHRAEPPPHQIEIVLERMRGKSRVTFRASGLHTIAMVLAGTLIIGATGAAAWALWP